MGYSCIWEDGLASKLLVVPCRLWILIRADGPPRGDDHDTGGWESISS